MFYVEFYFFSRNFLSRKNFFLKNHCFFMLLLNSKNFIHLLIGSSVVYYRAKNAFQTLWKTRKRNATKFFFETYFFRKKFNPKFSSFLHVLYVYIVQIRDLRGVWAVYNHWKRYLSFCFSLAIIDSMLHEHPHKILRIFFFSTSLSQTVKVVDFL